MSGIKYAVVGMVSFLVGVVVGSILESYLEENEAEYIGA